MNDISFESICYSMNSSIILISCNFPIHLGIIYNLIDNFKIWTKISNLTPIQQIKGKSSCKCLKKNKDDSKSNKMIIYAKISQNIFLLVFLLTRLHDNELKLFIHDFEYSTIDNTGSRQSYRSSEARKSSTTHRCTRARERGINPPKSSLSFPAPFYWPVFDWISSYQCSYWSVL